MENEPHHTWRRERTEPGPDLKLFRARFDHLRNPRNGVVERMIILEADDAVNVVARTPAGELLFVRQYRFGTQTYTLELPGGLIDAGEDPPAAARRELREETGHSAASWKSLGRIAANPVFMDSYIYHYFAGDVEHTHALRLDPGEEIEVVRLPIAEVRRRLLAGAFEHPHTVCALLRFFTVMDLAKDNPGSMFI